MASNSESRRRSHERLLPLYGQDRPWDASEWVASDDRVRGGSSQSYMRTINPERARFCGHLDISTLGGAGFASQHSLGTRHLDLSAYDGIVVDVDSSDGKMYTLILKDEVLPKRDDGREQSSVSWEYDFSCKGGEVRIAWDDFKPTYRGRPKPDARPLELTDIQRISIMMRSFFGKQEGDFQLDMHSMSAVVPVHTSICSRRCSRGCDDLSDVDSLQDKTLPRTDTNRGAIDVQAVGWLRWLCPGSR